MNADRSLLIDLRGMELTHFPDSHMDLQIRAGEVIGLAGPNGAGKSTLLRYLLGLDADRNGQFFQPAFSTAAVFQDPENNLIFSTLREDVAFGLRNLGRLFDTSTFAELLNIFRLEDLADRPFTSMSRSQLERAAFASIFSQRPELLLLDEVLTAQSPADASDILGAVLERARTVGMTVILASHEPELLRMTDRIVRLRQGEVDHAPAPVDTESMDESVSALAAAAGLKLAASETIGALRLDAYGFDEPGPVCLELMNASFGYPDTPLFRDVSLSLRRGMLYDLSGPSGSGKSTLLRMLAGLQPGASGTLTVFGEQFPAREKQSLRSLFRRESPSALSLRRQIGYAGQHAERQLFRDTVRDDAAFGPRNFGLTDPEGCAEQALREVGLNPVLWDRSPLRLSVGEQRKAAFAGVVAANPGILLLDEPYAELDSAGRKAMDCLILNRVRNGRTVVVSGSR